MGKGLGIGILLALALTGCGEGELEVVFKEDLKNVKREVVSEEIELPKEVKNNLLMFNLAYSIGNDVYGIKEVNSDSGVIDNGNPYTTFYEENLYKISTKEIIEKESGDKPIFLGLGLNKKGVGIEKTEEESVVEVFYYDEIKNKKMKIKDINIDISEKAGNNVITDIIDGGEYAFYNVQNEKSISGVEIIDIKTKKILEMDEKINTGVYQGFFRENKFYLLDFNLNLHVLELKEDTLKKEKTIDIREVFGLDKENYTEINYGYLKGDVINLIGDYQIGNHAFIGHFIIRYNVKTGHKVYVNLDEIKTGTLEHLDRNNEMIVWSNIDKDDMPVFYIGKLINERLEVISTLDFKEENRVTIDDCIFNEEGNEATIVYRVLGEYSSEPGEVKIKRFKIIG